LREDLANPRFHPFGKSRNSAFCVHASAWHKGIEQAAGCGQRFADQYDRNPLETTIALSHRFSRHARPLSGLKFAPRMAAGSCRLMQSLDRHTVFPDRSASAKEKPTAYLKTSIFFDTIVFTPEHCGI